MATLAIIAILLAAFFNAAWTAVSKGTLQKLPPDVFTVYMRFWTALFLLPLFVWNFEWNLSPSFWFWLALAGLTETIAIGCQSVGVRKDYFSTYSLLNTTPFFTLLLAPALLSEKLNLQLILGVLLIVAGAIFFVTGKISFSWFGLLAAVFFALNNITSKLAINESDPYFFAFPMVMLGIILFIPWTLWKRRTWTTKLGGKIWRPLIITSLFSALATIFFFIGIALGDVTRASALVRANLIFGFLISYFLLHERASWQRKLTAGMMICAGTILVSLA